MIFYKNPPKHYLSYVKNGKIPVILIPGISNRWGFLKNLGDKISYSGHPLYVVNGLGLNRLDISYSAKIVKELIEKMHLNKAVIVAHSKGGLIGKYYLTHENKDKKIKGLIAIAAPFSGSKIARHLAKKYSKELSPQSETIQSLNQHAEVNSRIISIMPEFDNHVWHEKGSYLEGAINIKTKTKGHHKIVFDKGVQDKITKLIEKFN